MDEELHYDEMTMEQLEAHIAITQRRLDHIRDELRRRLQAGQKSDKYQLTVKRKYN